MNTLGYESLLYIAELVGVAVFAISGGIAAKGKRLDILGVVVLAIVTSLGGGTIRDVVLDLHPLVWIADTTYLWTAILSAMAAFIVCRYLPYPGRIMLVLDAAGMALFSILGAERAMMLDLPAIIVVMMAIITGCAGGMIRDLLTGQIPMILHRDGELYATCALIGAVAYVMLQGTMEPQLLALLSMVLVFVIRLAAMLAHLCLPEFIMKGHKIDPDDNFQTPSEG